jgi:hypothetical protein
MKKMNKNIIQLHKPRVASTLAISFLTALVGVTATWIYLTSQVQTYWVVNEDAPVGSELASLPLSQVSANLVANKSRYFSSDQKPAGYLNKSLRAGELISVATISELPIGEFARVVVPSASKLPSSISHLSEVEVWVASRFGNEYGPASQLLPEALVIREVTSDAMFKQQLQQVELQIETAALPAMLDAVANESAIYLIPKS